MSTHPIIISGNLNDSTLETIKQKIGGVIQEQKDLLIINVDTSIPKQKLIELRNTLSEEYQIDINQLPETFDPSKIGLVLSDMDSTFIAIECIDEIADFANIKPQISEITELAMHGEIDFETSLKKRVGLLANLDTSALERVYKERLKLNPGAADLVKGLHENSIPFALVSGGFTYFTEKLKAEYQLDFIKANTLEVIDNKLSGKVLGEIVDAQTKAHYLEELCQTLGIQTNQVICMGDGANDLLMMEKAGLSVGYCAKPIVQEKADIVINHSGLNVLLDLAIAP
ncbi:MAG: phosphoserine phosphatase SerB [Gammaproteobacteria bacterium]|nr:phosphoserine phosphatase SerB [Gammaproteobacteria bacterium]